MNIVLLSELDERYADQAMDVFVDSFYGMFSKMIDKDKTVLHELFLHSFDRSMVYVCLKEDRVVGFLALGNAQRRPLHAPLQLCRKLFGRLKGSGMHWGLGTLRKPVVKGAHEGHIDHLATAADCRGQGIASSLIGHLCASLPYRSYTLEVLSKNTNARRLYERLGFRQIAAHFNPATSVYGFGRPLVMKLDLPPRS